MKYLFLLHITFFTVIDLTLLMLQDTLIVNII